MKRLAATFMLVLVLIMPVSVLAEGPGETGGVPTLDGPGETSGVAEQLSIDLAWFIISLIP